MDEITIKQIVEGLSMLGILGGFFFGIYKFIKKVMLDKIANNEKEIEKLKREVQEIKNDISADKEERLLLIKGQLACLKGLQELKCDGPVTQGIKDIEDYMLKKVHD